MHNTLNGMTKYLYLLLLFVASCLDGDLYDAATVRNMLQETGIPINSVTLISSGWDNLVADVNGEWIFRFPRTLEAKANIEKEAILLDRLHGHITMPIPHYEFTGPDSLFVGYKKLQGGPLTKELYATLSDDERNSIADDIALFLHELHQAISVEEAQKMGYKLYKVPVAWIKSDLLGTLANPDVERIISEALFYLSTHTTSQLVLAHNDLHGDNLAFDYSLRKITGIFDFSDAVIGDFAIDLGKSFIVDVDLGKRVCQAYSRHHSCPNPLQSAACDFILRRATFILHCRQSQEHEREQRLYQMLENFIPAWDEATIETKGIVNAS